MKPSVLEYINSRLGSRVVCTTSTVCNAVWTAACLVTVPAIIAGTIFMLAETPSVVGVDTQLRGPTLTTTRSTSLYVHSPVSLSKNIKVAEFHTYIKNERGEQVYSYPKILTENPDQYISFKLPKLMPGVYYVRTSIKYQLNPLKTADLDVGIARVVVEDPDKPEYSGVP